VLYNYRDILFICHSQTSCELENVVTPVLQRLVISKLIYDKRTVRVATKSTVTKDISNYNLSSTDGHHKRFKPYPDQAQRWFRGLYYPQPLSWLDNGL